MYTNTTTLMMVYSDVQMKRPWPVWPGVSSSKSSLPVMKSSFERRSKKSVSS